MASAILMRGKTVLEDPKALGNCVETAVFAHLSAHSIANHIQFSYWKDPKNNELDLVLELSQQIIPLEVKYHSQRTSVSDIQGLINFCVQKEKIKYAYVLTKESKDIGLIEKNHKSYSAHIVRIPAALFCYWLGEAEIHQKNILKS